MVVLQHSLPPVIALWAGVATNGEYQRFSTLVVAIILPMAIVDDNIGLSLLLLLLLHFELVYRVHQTSRHAD